MKRELKSRRSETIELPPEIWIQVCQIQTPVQYPHLRKDQDIILGSDIKSKQEDSACERRSKRLASSFLKQQQDSFTSTWSGSFNSNNNKDESAQIEIEIIESSKILSLVSKRLYDSISHLRFSILIFSDPLLFNEQTTFFQQNERFSSNVKEMLIDLDLGGHPQIIFKYQSENFEIPFPNVERINMNHFCSLKTLELKNLFRRPYDWDWKKEKRSEIDYRGQLLAPDLRGLMNLKFLIISSIQWVNLMKEMNNSSTSTSLSDENSDNANKNKIIEGINFQLPKLSRLIINSYSLSSRPLIPKSNDSVRKQLEMDLKMDLKKNGLISFLKILLGISNRKIDTFLNSSTANKDEEEVKVEEEEEMNTSRDQQEREFLQNLEIENSDDQGKLIIRPGLPTIETLCLELKEKLKKDLGVSESQKNFVVLEEFRSWIPSN